MRFLLPAALTCAVLSVGARTAAAQTPQAPPAPAPAGGAEALIIDQDRADRAPALPATPGPGLLAPEPAQGQVAAAAAQGRAIAQVQVEGSSLPAETLRAAWAPHVGRELSVPNLQALADALTRAYAGSDVALFKVEIPAQAFAGGAVRVQVTEGMIGQVAIQGDVQTRHLRLIQAYAAKIARETPLKRRTLERYLSLIRDIPGLTVNPSIKASALPGVSVLILDIARDRFDGHVTFSDRGTPRLGRVQAQGRVVINNLVRQGDQTQLTLAAPFEWEPMQYVSVAHSSIVGDEGLTLAGRAGYLRTRPKDSPIEGEAVTAGLSLTYPLRRGFTENVYLTGALDLQDSDNAVFGQTFSSDHTRAVRLGASWSKVEARRSSSASATASLGVDGLGARADARLTDADFRKLNLHASHNRALGEHWVARLRAAAQVSEGRLPSSEHMALGGDTFGRAFYSAYVTGDAGAAASGELAWRGEAWPSYLSGSELYGFVDWGSVTLRERVNGLAPERTYDLSSAGAGVRLNVLRKTVVYVEGATALENPISGNEAWRLLFGWRSDF